MPKVYVLGNWKMNKLSSEVGPYFQEINSLLEDIVDDGFYWGVAPSFLSIPQVKSYRKSLKGNFILGAQDVFYERKGAYTGEISPDMLKEFGVDFVIVGHSERRWIFREDEELIKRKVKTAHQEGFIVVLCIGEKLEERHSGLTFEVLKRQVLSGIELLENITERIVIAYEPVWAIGTGVNLNPQDAEEAHQYIKELLGSSELSVLYGGSVNKNNVQELIRMSNVDGLLVGGASLDPREFSIIIKTSYQTKKGEKK